MVLEYVQGEKENWKIAEVGMVSNRCLLIDAPLKSIQGRPQVILWSRGSLIRNRSVFAGISKFARRRTDTLGIGGIFAMWVAREGEQYVLTQELCQIEI